MIWNKEIECADRETMRALQLEKLQKTVKHEYDNVPAYRKKMDEAGVKPEDIKVLEDIQKLSDREQVVLGGIVTGIRQKYTKTGKPCGFITIEDFNGSGVLALFGEDWGRWAGMFVEGSTVYVLGELKQRFRDSNIFDLKVTDVNYMQTVKDKILTKLTISINTDKLDSQVVEELNELIKEYPGKTQLFFQLRDSQGKKHVLLKSRTRTVDVRSRLINYIDQQEGLEYKIN